jgi:hypothetical protein
LKTSAVTAADLSRSVIALHALTPLRNLKSSPGAVRRPFRRLEGDRAAALPVTVATPGSA